MVMARLLDALPFALVAGFVQLGASSLLGASFLEDLQSDRRHIACHWQVGLVADANDQRQVLLRSTIEATGCLVHLPP